MEWYYEFTHNRYQETSPVLYNEAHEMMSGRYLTIISPEGLSPNDGFAFMMKLVVWWMDENIFDESSGWGWLSSNGEGWDPVPPEKKLYCILNLDL